MKMYAFSVLADDDEEMVASILDALHERNVIRFAPAPDRLSAPPVSAAELEDWIAAADAQPRISFAEARLRQGL